jgi:hypothetical protein
MGVHALRTALCDSDISASSAMRDMIDCCRFERRLALEKQ